VAQKSDRLADRIASLVECSERLRDLLTRYEQVNLELAKRVGSGDGALVALHGIEAPIRRREVTETLEEFDAARHEVRLALLDACLDEGGTRSEIGRTLGISRQLASRLAAEMERRQATG